MPFLIAEALASNIGGTATLIGDPPNIIIASRADLTFNDFLLNLAPIVLRAASVVFLVLCRLMFGRQLRYHADRVEALMALDERDVIRDRGLLVKCAVVLTAVMVGFVAHSWVQLEPSLVALLGAGALVGLSRLDQSEYLEEVEWPTLVFFMGLFVMVGGLVRGRGSSTISATPSPTQSATGTCWRPASLLWGSALLSGLVDNIPYVATMTPLVQSLVDAGDGSGQAKALWWALALGADLGGNATAVGASANVVILGIAARNGHPISFWKFTKYGALTAFVTIAVGVGIPVAALLRVRMSRHSTRYRPAWVAP